MWLLGAGLKMGAALMVEMVEEVVVRGAVGRRLAWLGRVWRRESRGGPSKGEGEAKAGEEGGGLSSASMAVGGLVRRVGDGSGRGDSEVSSCLLRVLELLTCLDGLAGMLRLLVGLAKGLEGRSEAWLIWDGRRTKGLVFSGDKEPALVGDRPSGALVGEDVGVAARTVAGEAEFCRLKGDCRPVSWKERGRTGVDCGRQYVVYHRGSATYHCDYELAAVRVSLVNVAVLALSAGVCLPTRAGQATPGRKAWQRQAPPSPALAVDHAGQSRGACER